MTDSGMLSRDEPADLGSRSPMADQSVPASARAAMSGQDVLLATKLHVPLPPPGFVPRPRLAGAGGGWGGFAAGESAGGRGGGVRRRGCPAAAAGAAAGPRPAG